MHEMDETDEKDQLDARSGDAARGRSPEKAVLLPPLIAR